MKHPVTAFLLILCLGFLWQAHGACSGYSTGSQLMAKCQQGIPGRALKQEHLDYSKPKDDTAAEPQDTAVASAVLTREQIFATALGLVEQIFAATQDERVALLQLRVALTVCAFCPVPPNLQVQKYLQPIFALDGDLDRRFMLEKIFPALHGDGMQQHLLWVGVQPYTMRYEYALATHGIGMSSIEPDVTMHLYGSSQRHLFDTIQNIGKYDQLDTFDIIILNKVIGWGLEGLELRKAVKQMYKVMKPDGILVVGYVEGTECCDMFMPFFNPQPLAEDIEQTVDLEEEGLHHYYQFFVKDPTIRSMGHQRA